MTDICEENKPKLGRIATKKSYQNFLKWVAYLSLILVSGSLSYSWYFLTQKLSPLIETELTNFLNRPLKLGKLEYISLTKLRFSKSEIPATKTDNDYAEFSAIDIKINPLLLITKKTLQIELDLIQPNIYLDENDQNTWIETQIDKGIPEWKGIKINLKNIDLTNSNVTLKAYSKKSQLKPTIKLKVDSTNFKFKPEKITFFTEGKSIKGGNFQLTGIYKTPIKNLDLLIEGKEILATEISNLLLLPLELSEGKIDSNLSLNLTAHKKINIKGNSRLKNVTLNIPNLSKSLSKTNADITFNSNGLNINKAETNFDLIAAKFQGLIDYHQGNIFITANTKKIDINNIFKSLNLPKSSLLIKGEIEGKLNITGKIKQPKLIAEITGNNNSQIDKVKLNSIKGNLELFNSELKINNLTLFPTIGGEIISEGKINLAQTNSQFLFNINTDNIVGSNLTEIYQFKTSLDVGKISGKYQLSGNWKRLNLSRLTGITNVNLGGGKFIFSDFKHDQQNWQGNLKFRDINLSTISPNICLKINCNNSKFNGNFLISGNNNLINFSNINAKGNSQLNLAQEVINFDNVELNKGNWKTLITTKQLKIDQIYSTNFKKFNTKIDSNLEVTGSIQNMQTITANGKGKLITSEGEIDINNFQLKENNFNLNLITNAFNLDSISNQLRGKGKGLLNIKGNLKKININKLDIFGNLLLSEGINFVTKPINTNFNWNGQNLVVNKAESDNIQAKGLINFDSNNKQISTLDLDIISKNLDLKTLPIQLSSELTLLNYQGNIDFNGKVYGEINQLNLKGDLALNNFITNGFNFNNLTGNINFKNQEKFELNLTENNEFGDRLKINLDGNNKPNKIDIEVDKTTFLGIKENEIFTLSANNIPLKLLTKSLPISLENKVTNLEGNLSSKIYINLDNYDVIDSDIKIEKPIIDNFKANLITTKINYIDQTIGIKEGKITQENSNYSFNADINNSKNLPEFTANLKVEKGNIQDLLESLEIFEWNDFKEGIKTTKYAKPEDLLIKNKQQNLSNNSNDSSASSASLSTGKPNESIKNQLDYFNKISESVAQKLINKEKLIIPELAELKGNYNGNLTVQKSREKGLTAEFDFNGQNWNLGKYQADLITAKGSYENGLLTFLPIQIKHKETIFSLLGSFKKEKILGQLQVNNLSLKDVQNITNFSNLIDLNGTINANIAISGNEKNPLAKGEINIDNATINNTKIDSNKASFNYKNSRLSFFASSYLQKDLQPLIIKGSFPYQLFNNSIPAENNQFDVNLTMNDDVFSLLNVVSNNQIKWLQGNGKINLDIVGNYEQKNSEFSNIKTQGIATLENAEIQANFLPNNQILKEINSKILFDFNQIRVDNFTSKFSQEIVNITGTLPIIISDNTVKNDPLRISFNNLAIDLKDIYQGKTKGNINIIGSLISPKLTGDLTLFNGQILLAKEDEKETKINDLNTNQLFVDNIKFENFTLNLGENLSIIKEPILTTVATGNLILNGNLNQIKPEGNIYLTNGKVNLFTSQLKLAESHQNIAKFTSENGFDPFLDVQLLSSVSETNRYQSLNSEITNEIQDISNSEIGKVQTIQVKANIKGLSSQLTEKLELKSNPQRSESEIIALLGGGIFNNFRGDNTLTLANLASAAFLGSFQPELGKALGLSEFRLFPTQVINPEKRTSDFNLGVEATIDVNPNLSLSVIKILTSQQAAQYGIKYRINEQTLLKGSTDFNNDSRGAIEFEHRF